MVGYTLDVGGMRNRRRVSRRWARYTCLLTCLLAACAGNLAANGIIACDLNGVNVTGSCYSSSTFFNNNLTLDWGTAFGPADYKAGVNPNAGPWNTIIGGVHVSLSVGGDFSAVPAVPLLARVDSSYMFSDPTTLSYNIQQFGFDPLHMYDPGHFNAPASNVANATTDHLVELYNGAGSIVITFDQGVTRAGLLLSTLGSSFNMDFRGTIEALDSRGVLLGIYGINTTGVGGECLAPIVGGVRHACNDAPFIGITASNNNLIYSLIISTSNGGTLLAPVLDSLMFQTAATDIPEPTFAFLTGLGCLAAVCFRKYGKKGQGGVS